MSEQKTKRPVGRPRNPNRTEQRAKRRFWPLEKTPAMIELMQLCQQRYFERYGKKGSIADVIRAALLHFYETMPPF